MARTVRLLSWCLPLLALTVIVFGAYVRLSDAGLGCPDWPGCYGHLSVPAAASDIHLSQAEWHARPLEPGKAWREMVHRYLASTLGLGIVLLAACAWSAPTSFHTSRAAYALVPLVIFQGLLGMWTVTLLLKPLIVSAHLLGGLATLSLLWWNLLVVQQVAAVPDVSRLLAFAARAALVVLLVQIFLGGWTSANYAALACTDFPTCQGSWMPATDFANGFVLWRGLGVNYEFGVLETPARTAIHLVHRLGAVVAATLVLTVAMLALRHRNGPLRRTAWCMIAAVIAQLCLGVSNVLGGLPLPVAVGHNAGASLLLLTLLTIVYLTRSSTEVRQHAPAMSPRNAIPPIGSAP